MLLGYGLQRRAEFPISAAGQIVTNSATERLNFTTPAVQIVQFSTAHHGHSVVRQQDHDDWAVTDDTVAGYRTVRAVGETAEAQVFLVHAGGNEHERVEPGSTRLPPQIRALKRFHSSVPTSRILTEVECLSRARGHHIIAVDDIASAADGSPVVVLGWVGSGTLRRLLRERSSLRSGEAITILAPLLGALSRVHQTGVALGDVSLDAIQFDETGCPFFAEFGSSRCRLTTPTPLEIQRDESFRDDRRQLANVANSVLAAVHAERDVMRLVSELSSWVSDDAHTGDAGWHQTFEQQLFSLSAPEPLRLVEDAKEISIALPPSAPLVFSSAGRDGIQPSSDARVILALPHWLDSQLGETLRAANRNVVERRDAIAAWCRPVRKRTWVLAAVAVTLLIAAVVLFATEEPPESQQSQLQQQVAVPDVDRGSSQRIGSDGDDLKGDANQALTALLSLRAECLRNLSVVCLETVSSSGTPAYLSDVALINSVIAGGELPPNVVFDAAESIQKQQLGDSVLFEFGGGDTSKPASILLVKGEAGWRIRSYMLPG